MDTEARSTPPEASDEAFTRFLETTVAPIAPGIARLAARLLVAVRDAKPDGVLRQGVREQNFAEVDRSWAIAVQYQRRHALLLTPEPDSGVVRCKRGHRWQQLEDTPPAALAA